MNSQPGIKEGATLDRPMQQPDSSGLGRSKWLYRCAALIITVGVIAAGFYIDRLNNIRHEQEVRNDVLSQLSVVRARLEGAISSNIQTVRGLVAAISVEPDMNQDRFTEFAHPLFDGRAQLRNIGAAPDMVIRLIYPLQGNEGAIGLDLSATPDQREAAEQARHSGQPLVTGPVKLVQGGYGFIGRIPVFTYSESGKKERFWGLVSAVIDVEELYRASGLTSAAQGLDIAIRSAYNNDTDSDVFYGDPEIFHANPVIAEVTLPNGAWRIGATPQGGWPQLAEGAIALRISVLTIGLLILTPTLLVFRQIRKRHENEMLLRSLFDLSPLGIALNDYKTGDFLEVNNALLGPTGYTRKEFLMLSYWDITPKDYEELESQQLEQLSIRGRYGPYEKEYIRKSGDRYPVLLNGVLISDTQGREYIWSIIEDISERKQAEAASRVARQQIEQSQKELQNFFDLSTNFLCIANTEGYFERINFTFSKVLGYSERELLSEPIVHFIHPDDVESTLLELKKLARGKPAISFVNRYRCYSGEIVTLLWNAACDPASGKIYATAVDITAQRNAQMELTEAKEAAEAAARAKSDFLATMSHEIRTPMNGVLGMLNLVLHSKLDSEQQRKVNIAKSSAESLLSLINDILDFSKVDAGKLELELLDFDLRHHLDEFAGTMALRAQEKELELVLDQSAVEQSMVRGDPGRLRQILTNLVSNAIKFTAEGEIVIRCQLQPEEDHLLLTVSVTDTGIGIPAEKIGGLFEPFTQVDASTTRQFGGTGLGLAICKRLSELMDGGITVHSEQGKGSCFEFCIRLQRSELTQPILPKVDMRALSLLVVDDNAANREVLCGQLRMWGAHVLETASGEEALAMCEAKINGSPAVYGRPFDIAILDMHMPQMDGAMLGRELKANAAYRNMALVMMTSIGHRGDARYFAELGFSAYLPKPVTVAELSAALSVVAEGGDALRQAKPLVTRHYARSLPASDAAESDTAETHPPMQWPAHSRLLLVEDNQVNQEVAQLMLEEMGLPADVAGNGLEALAALQSALEEAPYNLVLMDCQMPEMDGYEATRQIRAGKAGEHNRHIPIVAMTANAMKGDREKCLASGMDDYLSKPISASGLEEKLKLWLFRRSSARPGLQILGAASEEGAEADTVGQEPLQLWDEKAALESLMGKHALLSRLLGGFCSRLPERLAALQEAISESDTGKVEFIAHSIKGAAGQLHAQQLQHAASALENAASLDDIEEVNRLLPGFVSASEQLARHFDHYLNTRPVS
ncbi:response regulator [Hahella sp. CR1]|uniref:response regulator n=1 Tax=Hahella sp. CR1 TaxID=2992807 RepID=UPI002441730E|nr:response regulator [Hahella sp. CR1]